MSSRGFVSRGQRAKPAAVASDAAAPLAALDDFALGTEPAPLSSVTVADASSQTKTEGPSSTAKKKPTLLGNTTATATATMPKPTLLSGALKTATVGAASLIAAKSSAGGATADLNALGLDDDLDFAYGSTGAAKLAAGKKPCDSGDGTNADAADGEAAAKPQLVRHTFRNKVHEDAAQQTYKLSQTSAATTGLTLDRPATSAATPSSSLLHSTANPVLGGGPSGFTSSSSTTALSQGAAPQAPASKRPSAITAQVGRPVAGFTPSGTTGGGSGAAAAAGPFAGKSLVQINEEKRRMSSDHQRSQEESARRAFLGVSAPSAIGAIGGGSFGGGQFDDEDDGLGTGAYQRSATSKSARTNVPPSSAGGAPLTMSGIANTGSGGGGGGGGLPRSRDATWTAPARVRLMPPPVARGLRAFHGIDVSDDRAPELFPLMDGRDAKLPPLLTAALRRAVGLQQSAAHSPAPEHPAMSADSSTSLAEGKPCVAGSGAGASAASADSADCGSVSDGLRLTPLQLHALPALLHGASCTVVGPHYSGKQLLAVISAAAACLDGRTAASTDESKSIDGVENPSADSDSRRHRSRERCDGEDEGFMTTGRVAALRAMIICANDVGQAMAASLLSAADIDGVAFTICPHTLTPELSGKATAREPSRPRFADRSVLPVPAGGTEPTSESTKRAREDDDADTAKIEEVHKSKDGPASSDTKTPVCEGDASSAVQKEKKEREAPRKRNDAPPASKGRFVRKESTTTAVAAPAAPTASASSSDAVLSAPKPTSTADSVEAKVPQESMEHVLKPPAAAPVAPPKMTRTRDDVDASNGSPNGHRPASNGSPNGHRPANIAVFTKSQAVEFLTSLMQRFDEPAPLAGSVLAAPPISSPAANPADHQGQPNDDLTSAAAVETPGSDQAQVTEKPAPKSFRAALALKCVVVANAELWLSERDIRDMHGGGGNTHASSSSRPGGPHKNPNPNAFASILPDFLADVSRTGRDFTRPQIVVCSAAAAAPAVAERRMLGGGRGDGGGRGGGGGRGRGGGPNDVFHGPQGPTESLSFEAVAAHLPTIAGVGQRFLLTTPDPTTEVPPVLSNGAVRHDVHFVPSTLELPLLLSAIQRAPPPCCIVVKGVMWADCDAIAKALQTVGVRSAVPRFTTARGRDQVQVMREALERRTLAHFCPSSTQVVVIPETAVTEFSLLVRVHSHLAAVHHSATSPHHHVPELLPRHVVSVGLPRSSATICDKWARRAELTQLLSAQDLLDERAMMLADDIDGDGKASGANDKKKSASDDVTRAKRGYPPLCRPQLQGHGHRGGLLTSFVNRGSTPNHCQELGRVLDGSGVDAPTFLRSV